MIEPGILYIVATPIGNLEDITLRAIRILKEVDVILCEDTRTTGILLKKYDIKNKLLSYNAHATTSKHTQIVKMIEDGMNLALVSDAGTPCISDPGVMLVRNIIEVFGKDAHIVPIPGPSALISAVSASGAQAAEFTFLGFLPHKKGRQTIFKQIKENLSHRPVVFYESIHRIQKTLASLAEYMPQAHVVIAREITKQFEEFVRGKPSEILEYFEVHKDKHRGEFVVIVSA